MKTADGLTLIEMLVVLGILGLIIGLLTPIFFKTMEQNQEKVLQAALTVTIHEASEQAILRALPVAIRIDASDERHKRLITFMNPRQDGILLSQANVIAYHPLPPMKGNLYFQFYPKYRDFLLFFPRTAPYSDNGSLWYCDKPQGDALWAITLNKNSEVNLVYADRNGHINNKKLACTP